jgi:hypothetical protein
VFKSWKSRIAAAILLLLVVVFLLTRGPEAPMPNPPGAFSFAVLGDAPYYEWEELQYRLVLQTLEANELSFVIDVGDIFWRPCSDQRFRRTLNELNGLRHPVIYTPGDNEWADCWEPRSGAFSPLDRLNRIRQIFFQNPTSSLGRNTLTIESQGSRGPFSEFVENARWEHQGIVFATVHIVGSNNGMRAFPARSEANDVESRRRTDAAAAWVRETFAAARKSNASAVVLSFHANADLESRTDEPYRQAFEPFLTAVEEEAELFARPVLLAHGDGHKYTVDHPVVRRTTGRTLENLTRLQVPGSPAVGWVRVVVTPGAAAPFVFEAHVVPRWKYW